MKIAISSSGANLDARVDPRFGRCRCFVIIDPATNAFEVLENEAAMLSGGAGIQAAQMVVNAGVDAVITGSLGPNAGDVLGDAGLKVYLGAAGTIREVLRQYQDGRLQEVSGPSVGAPFGTRGFGRGRGMGMGRRYIPQPQAAPAGELEELKRRKDELREQISRIEKRIKELEKKL